MLIRYCRDFQLICSMNSSIDGIDRFINRSSGIIASRDTFFILSSAAGRPYRTRGNDCAPWNSNALKCTNHTIDMWQQLGDMAGSALSVQQHNIQLLQLRILLDDDQLILVTDLCDVRVRTYRVIFGVRQKKSS